MNRQPSAKCGLLTNRFPFSLRSKSRNNLVTVLSIVCALLSVTTLSGCSDEIPFSDKEGNLRISFAVETVPANPAARATRSGSGIMVGDAVQVSGSDHPTWLIPIEQDGIIKGNPTLASNVNNSAYSTRGTLLNNETIASMGVYAWRSDGKAGQPDYMYNVAVTREASWTPSDEYLWPSDASLHFLAYSPYQEAAVTSEGIIRLPSITGPMTLDYISPDAVADQSDLMVATPMDASASPVKITFNHALSGIRFATGAKLSPCKIKKIILSGVSSSGTLNLESAAWSNLSGSGEWSISPDIDLSAVAGSEFVEAGKEISAADSTILMIPQTLGENAKLSVIVESNGILNTMTASLSGQEWKAGKTTTYRISGSPDSDILILDVSGSFKAPYNGATLPFSVSSYYSSKGTVSPVEWKAEFTDSLGNAVKQPVWISTASLGGNGNDSCSIITTVNNISMLATSPETARMRAAANINSSSGMNPYNLGSASGSAKVENTANSYIISAPGRYSIPLVYGNAIKNGNANTAAYTYTGHTSSTLKNFTNHLGAAISSPYIYENADCTPASASLVWEDQLNLIQNVALSDDNHSITFEVPENSIRQGNALVAVRDSQGRVMWSWHLWATDFNPAESLITLNDGSASYQLWPEEIGFVTEGDDVLFPEGNVWLRFTQTNVPAGKEPLTKMVKLTQEGIETHTNLNAAYYQWGRKDAMVPAVNNWYNASHEIISNIPTFSVFNIPDLLTWEIQHPEVWAMADHNSPAPYRNMWNPGMASRGGVKSIYDPCPVGAQVSDGTPFLYLLNSATGLVGNNAYELTLNGKSYGIFHFLGYRQPSTGNITNYGNSILLWTSSATTNRIEARTFIFSNTQHQVLTDPVFSGFVIRPVAEN